VEDRNSFVFDEFGKISHLLSAIIDITDRKEAEAQLRQSEDRLREILAKSLDILVIVDKKGVFLYVSVSTERILKYEPSELIGKNGFDYIHPEDLEKISGIFNILLSKQNKGTPTEFRFRRGDGTWAHLEALGNNCLENPAIEGIIINAREISERKRADAEIKKSEARLQELLRHSFDIVVVVDKNGFFSYISPSVKNILGYEEIDLIGKNCFDFVHPEEKGKAVSALKYIVKTKKSGIIIEFRFRHANGSWSNMEVLANNCLENPAVGGIVISVRDVTDRRHIEQRLQHSRKMEAIGTLAGGIAHEFNNLLMGIQGYVSLMLINKDCADPDFAKLESIQSLIKSGADLTGKLLGFAQGGQYEVKITDINDLVAKTVSLFGRTKKDITIHQKYAKNLWSAKIDRSQLEQILMDMYVNAWQAMTRDGGDIYVETDNVQIDLAKAELLKIKAGNYVRITIIDTGSGMDEETCARIFEPFFTTKEKSRGVGLSLASAYGIVRSHEGAIEVASELGRGTIFNIYLPVSAEEAPREVAPSKAMARGAETILLVDDEESVLYVCKEILATIGYNVLTAANGREALNIYKEHKNAIDLVVLDMIMPGLSGSETYEELKLINPQVKVMVSTGYSVSEQAKKIMEKGCQAIIQKPFRLEDLSQKVREVIGQK